MIDLTNYALLAEHKKFGYKLNEKTTPLSKDEFKLREDEFQNQKGLDYVLSGKTNPQYAEQYNQLVDNATKNAADRKFGKCTVIIYWEVGEYLNLNSRRPMISIDYVLETTGKVKAGSLTPTPGAATDKEAAASTGPVTQAIKDAAQKIWVALVGSTFDEKEDDVYKVFRDDIKTDADLQSLLAYWKSLKIPYVSASTPNYSYLINTTSLEKTSLIYTKSTNLTDERYTLGYWLGILFNGSEISKVNSYLKAYSQTQFDNIGTF